MKGSEPRRNFARSSTTLSPVSAMKAPSPSALFPIRMHPRGVPMRRPAPFATDPDPARAVQIPVSIRPNVTWSRRIADRSNHHWRRRRWNRITNVRLRCAGSQRDGCKHHASEHRLFDLHEKALHIRLDWRALAAGFAYEREVILHSIHPHHCAIATCTAGLHVAWLAMPATPPHTSTCAVGPVNPEGSCTFTCCTPAIPGATPP